MRPPTPKTLILDLLSSLRGHSMPVRALVGAAAVFGISPESLRVALVRLGERGTVARDARGHYRLAERAEPVQRHVAGWNRLEERLAPWRGGWVAVHTAALGRADRASLRRRERAFGWLGLRSLAPHLYVRPDNLRGGVDGVRDELRSLGLEPEALVFGIAAFDAGSEARARALWDTAALRRTSRDAAAALRRSAAQLDALPPERAMVESFLLGGEAIRTLAHDPLLPEPLVPHGERAALVAALRDYDRLGRARWREFLRAHGAPHLSAPRAAVDGGWSVPVSGGTA
ncbi:MAG: PaaX family transcriptional regulator C-terminal domain-containing protein [Deltaproteobacteria bacterium]|nr:PaaX family transcriptional regulator C-terminal domain-containing protein [Deltaproteobacteria bacterium]